MAKPILDLDTLADRPVITIDTKEYWLITPDIMPVSDNHLFTKKGARLDTLRLQVELTEDEQAESARITDELCRLVLEAPDAVHEGLTDRKRLLIIGTALTTFRNGLRMGLPMPAAPESTTASPTGTTSSPA